MSKKWKRHEKLSAKFLGLCCCFYLSAVCIGIHFVKMKNHLRCTRMVCALCCIDVLLR